MAATTGLTIANATRVGYEKPFPLFGILKGSIVTITFDSSYPTGGEALTPATLGLQEILGILQLNKDVDLAGHDLSYDAANDKLLCFDDEGVEIGNAVDLSTLGPLCLVIGY